MPPIDRYPRPNMFTQRDHHYSMGRPTSTHQRKYLDEAEENAAYQSGRHTEALYARGESRGYSRAEVDAGRRRMAETHSTINFNPAARLDDGTSVMEAMADDDYHRNMFETNISGAQLGQAQRQSVENSLYDNHYRGVPAYAHPSYGALNMTNSPHGVAPFAGDAHLRIKPETHDRATYSYFDSARANRRDELGTRHHNDHVLYKTTNHTFDNVMGRRPSSPADPHGDYVEVQYHGRVRYSEDVDSLNVHDRHRDTEIGGHARRFRDNHGTKLYWVDDRGERRPSYGGDGGYDRHPGYYR